MRALFLAIYFLTEQLMVYFKLNLGLIFQTNSEAVNLRHSAYEAVSQTIRLSQLSDTLRYLTSILKLMKFISIIFSCYDKFTSFGRTIKNHISSNVVLNKLYLHNKVRDVDAVPFFYQFNVRGVIIWSFTQYVDFVPVCNHRKHISMITIIKFDVDI